jgi:molybdenum cofactor cytidylyltransferase
MSIGALLLAAGASTRLGHPKQLVRLNGETLLARSIRIAAEAACAPIVTVLGASEELIREQCDLGDVLVVTNPMWAEGMGSSLSVGAKAFGEVRGVVVMTCDMPAVDAKHLRAISASGRLTASAYGGRKGVPAYFPQSFLAALAECRGDAGARSMLQKAPAVELVNGDLDIDSPEDLARALQLYGRADTV